MQPQPPQKKYNAKHADEFRRPLLPHSGCRNSLHGKFLGLWGQQGRLEGHGSRGGHVGFEEWLAWRVPQRFLPGGVSSPLPTPPHPAASRSLDAALSRLWAALTAGCKDPSHHPSFHRAPSNSTPSLVSTLFSVPFRAGLGGLGPGPLLRALVTSSGLTKPTQLLCDMRCWGALVGRVDL